LLDAVSVALKWTSGGEDTGHKTIGDPMSDTGFVYVVDDDASVREGVARLIRSAGVMTQTFASGEEFLATARPKKPGCLVLDVNLPGLTGLDLQQEMAKSGVELPIIFLTGHGDIPMTVRALKAGAVNFLTKPFDDEDLLNAIDQCLTSGCRMRFNPKQDSTRSSERVKFFGVR
jgi:FixJ family two-component response regulator